jgi:hypothetical protein
MTDRKEYITTKIYNQLACKESRNKTEERIFSFLDRDNCYIIYDYGYGVLYFEPICHANIPLYFQNWVKKWCNRNGYSILIK